MIRAIILIISILNPNVTINVSIKWCYRKKVLRNHEVYLTMIYYRMKFRSVGSAEFNTAYFHALWFCEVDGLVQERRNSFLTHLSCVFLAITHRNESTSCTRTFMCPWWLLEQPFGQTLEWLVSWDSIAYDSYISVDLHACAENFSWVFPRVQPQYSPKPIQILINTLRPKQWWLMFGTHFQYIFLIWNWLKFVHLSSWL